MIAASARAFATHEIAREDRVALRLRIPDELKAKLDQAAPVLVTSKAGIGTLLMMGAALEDLVHRDPKPADILEIATERLASYL